MQIPANVLSPCTQLAGVWRGPLGESREFKYSLSRGLAQLLPDSETSETTLLRFLTLVSSEALAIWLLSPIMLLSCFSQRPRRATSLSHPSALALVFLSDMCPLPCGPLCMLLTLLQTILPPFLPHLSSLS